MWPSNRARPARPDLDLVERMRSGDESAFDEFAAAFLPGLLRFAMRQLGGNAELARDLTQATACRALERLDSYRGEAPLFTWLCACCRNEIAGHFRRQSRRPREVVEAPGADGEPEPLLASLAAPGPGPESALLELEEREQVHAALDRLPAAQAQAIELRYLEGLGVDEIAARLGSTYKATESLLSRARKGFAESFRALARGAGPASGSRHVAARGGTR